jgi:hypothetical protein
MINFINKLRAKKVLSIGGLVILVIGLLVGIYLVSQTQIFKPRASENSEVSLSFTAPDAVEPNQTFSVDLLVKSSAMTANLLVAQIGYPANLLEVTNIATSSSVLTNIFTSKFDNNIGSIDIAGGVPNPGFATAGSDPGIIAKVTFRAKAVGEATLTYGDSKIFSNATNEDILNKLNTAKITIASPIQSSLVPSPSASPSSSPTPTPIASLSPAPSPSTAANPFSNLSATLTKDKAQFNFSYSGTPDAFNISLGTAADLIYGTNVYFAGGSNSPVINNNPQGTWEGYKCGQVFYWSVRSNYVPRNSSIEGPIVVQCP